MCIKYIYFTFLHCCMFQHFCTRTIVFRCIRRSNYFKDFSSGPNQYNTASPAFFGFSNTYSQKFNGEKTNDGMFSFQNSLNDDFDQSWHTGAQDHTPGDVGGYMLVVNAD